MKVKIEVDLTPEEALELFAGNVESMQNAMLNLVSRKAGDPSKGGDMLEYWRTMAEQSQAMFDAYNRQFQSSQSANKRSGKPSGE